LQLQKEFHPDKFTLKSEEEQAHSAHMSALINEAYKTLTSPLRRAVYLVLDP